MSFPERLYGVKKSMFRYNGARGDFVFYNCIARYLPTDFLSNFEKNFSHVFRKKKYQARKKRMD